MFLRPNLWICGGDFKAFPLKRVHGFWRFLAEGESLEAGYRDFLSLSNGSIKGRRVGDKPWLKDGVWVHHRCAGNGWGQSSVQQGSSTHHWANNCPHMYKEGRRGEKKQSQMSLHQIVFWKLDFAKISPSWVYNVLKCCPSSWWALMCRHR